MLGAPRHNSVPVPGNRAMKEFAAMPVAVSCPVPDIVADRKDGTVTKTDIGRGW